MGPGKRQLGSDRAGEAPRGAGGHHGPRAATKGWQSHLFSYGIGTKEKKKGFKAQACHIPSLKSNSSFLDSTALHCHPAWPWHGVVGTNPHCFQMVRWVFSLAILQTLVEISWSL